MLIWFVTGLEDTVKLVKGIGGKCYGYIVDLASKEDIYRVARQVDEEVGRVSTTLYWVNISWKCKYLLGQFHVWSV